MKQSFRRQDYGIRRKEKTIYIASSVAINEVQA